MLSILLQKLSSLAGLHVVQDLGKTLIYCRRSFLTHYKKSWVGFFFFYLHLFSAGPDTNFGKLFRQAPNATCHPQDMEKSMSRRPLRWVTFQVWEGGVPSWRFCLSRCSGRQITSSSLVWYSRKVYTLVYIWCIYIWYVWYIPYRVSSCHTLVKSGAYQPQLRKPLY